MTTKTPTPVPTIQDFYKLVLESLRFRVEEDGLISHLNLDGTAFPSLVKDEKRLVLPTDDFLKGGIPEDLQPFHPLSESIARKGISPVLNRLQKQAKYNLAQAFVGWAAKLLEVAADPALQKDLPPACSEYLKKVPKADKKCIAAFENLIQKAAAKNQLITLYLKNGGVYQGKKVNRLCVIRFPIMDLLDGGEEKPLGVKLSKKERETISAILHHVMPFGNDPEEYSAGSDSRIAPYFDAFMKAYGKAAAQLNLICRKYGKAMAMSVPEFNLDYLEELPEMGRFYDALPPLKGNQGEGEEEPKAPTSPTTAAAQVQSAPSAHPTTASGTTRKTEPVPKAGGMSVKDFMAATRPPQPAYPQPGYGQPTPPPGQPAYGQPQPAYGYANPYAQPAHYPYGGYGQPQPPADPRRPAWLVGGTPGAPAAPQNPFAEALRTPTPGHGGYGGGNNDGGWSGGL